MADVADGPPSARGPRPAPAFAALGLLFGLAFALLTPPLQAPDELRHLARAWAISRGEILAQIGPEGTAQVRVPRNLLELEGRLGARALRHHPNRRQDFAKLATELARPLDAADQRAILMPSLYSPVPYLPQALAIAAARPLGASAVGLVYAGRLANLLTYVALVVCALRWLPAHASVVLLLALTPMALFEAGSLSADAATIALAFLWFAAVLRAAARSPAPVSRRELAGLAGLAALMGLAKQAYAPLVLLVWLVPRERFATPRRRAVAAAAVLAAGLLPAALWFAALRALPLAPLTYASDPEAQLRFVMEHPLRTLGVFATTLWYQFPRYVRTFVGNLGSVDTPLPGALYLLHPLALLACAAWDGGRASPVRGRRRLLLLAVAAVCWLSTMTLSYVGWNRLADTVVRYVQGRYFLPFAPLLLAAVHLPASPGLSARARWAALAWAAGVLGIAVAAVSARYWGA